MIEAEAAEEKVGMAEEDESTVADSIAVVVREAYKLALELGVASMDALAALEWEVLPVAGELGEPEADPVEEVDCDWLLRKDPVAAPEALATEAELLGVARSLGEGEALGCEALESGDWEAEMLAR